MAESVYRVTEVIGVSGESWEAAARNAVETAAKSVRDLRVAEVLRNDVTIENGSISSYRVRLAISFKDESGEGCACNNGAWPRCYVSPAAIRCISPTLITFTRGRPCGSPRCVS